MNAQKDQDDQPAALAATLTQLTERAQKGDALALAELRDTLRAHPEWQTEFTDLAAVARQKRTAVTFGERNLLASELLERRAAEMRRELEGQHPTPLERLLVERVVTCWATVYLADVDGALDEDLLERAEYYDRRHQRAHRRYLDAVMTLARVRRLLSPLPLLAQVNIAQAGAQQLNVSTSAEREPRGGDPSLPPPTP